MNFDLIIEKIISLDEPFVLITQISNQGSAPADIGAKAIVTQNGLILGTVGGGKIEAHCIQTAKELLLANKNQTLKFKWNLQTDIKMTCGGVVEYLFEVQIKQTWPIFIFGAGHVSQALVPILSTLNCQMTIVDHREEWLDKIPSLKNVKKINSHEYAELLSNAPAHAFILCLTMGHSTDLPVLKKALEINSFPYIGVIGSKSKKNTIFKELSELGVSPEKFNQIYCPMGLPIGNNSPQEIAISITSQLIQVRDSINKL